jgi:photosystem II stability/assembly factor-like uncharacterized protein
MRTRLAAGAIVAALCLSGARLPAHADVLRVEPVLSGSAHQALFAVAFDGDRGVAVGAAGRMLLTADGGKTWQESKTGGGTSLSLLGVDLGGGGGIAVGQGGVILVQREGAAWRKVDAPTHERLFGVIMNSQGTAVAVGAFGTILRSNDRGLTWQSIAPADIAQYSDQGEQPHLYAASITDQGVIVVVGEFGLVLRTDDDGAHWKAMHKGEASLFAIDLHSGAAGYAVGQNGTILRTPDGGVSWSAMNSNSTANLLSVSSSGRGPVVVTAMHDVLSSSDGTSWHQAKWGDFASAWYSGVRFAGSASPPAAVLVGHSGRILRMEEQ